MKHRNVIAVVVLSIITFGIYDLFWLHSTKKDLNQRSDVHIPSMWLLFAPFIAVVLALPLLFIVGMSGGSSHVGSLLVAIFEFLAVLLILPVTVFWTLKYSKAVNHVTHGELSTAIVFILFWVLRFIGLAIIQDKFNDMVAAGAGVAGAAPVPQTAGNQSFSPVAAMSPMTGAEQQPTPAAGQTAEVPAGAFNPVQPTESTTPAASQTVGAPEPPTTPADPAPQVPAAAEQTPPTASDTGEPKPPAA